MMRGICLDQILGMAILPSPQICTSEQFQNSMKSIRYKKIYVCSEILPTIILLNIIYIYMHVYINNHEIGIRNATDTPPKLAGQTTGIRRQWQKQCKKPFLILHTCYIEIKISVMRWLVWR